MAYKIFVALLSAIIMIMLVAAYEVLCLIDEKVTELQAAWRDKSDD